MPSRRALALTPVLTVSSRSDQHRHRTPPASSRTPERNEPGTSLRSNCPAAFSEKWPERDSANTPSAHKARITRSSAAALAPVT